MYKDPKFGRGGKKVKKGFQKREGHFPFSCKKKPREESEVLSQNVGSSE
jgi:hypothetical protein